MRYESLFTSGAVNTVANGILWIESQGENEPVRCAVYAVHNLLAVLDLSTKRVVRTIRGFSGNVTALSSCSTDNGDVAVAASCDDGGVYVTTHADRTSIDSWSTPMRLDGLTAATSGLHCLSLGDTVLVGSADAKGNAIVWKFDTSANSGKAVWTTKLTSAQLAKSILFAILPSATGANPTIGMFVGSVDARVHIYCASIEAATSAGQAPDSPPLFSPVGALSGHEEWVTCLSATPVADAKALFVASGSQDSKIRVWNIKLLSGAATVAEATIAVNPSSGAGELDAELDVQADAVEGEVIVESNEDETESEARLLFTANGAQFAVLLESLLVGHEDWVTTVQWLPTSRSADGSPLYQLFSTSMDRNMVIWAPDATAGGVWVPQVRMGDIGGALGGSIGGNLLGFVGGCTSPRGDSLIGIGYGGSFHLWTKLAGEEAGSDGRWVPLPLASGHFASVNDLCWSDDSHGDYLITASADQTCRVFAPLRGSGAWKEISRPEIHGYDLNCLAVAPQRGLHTLYTAGEEKLIRVFDAPAGVLRGLEALCGISYEETTGGSAVKRIEQAYIPELGLSNKAQEYMSKQEQTEQEARSVARINWTSEPLESQLSDLTLWPEVNKMFGHNNEVMCMAMSSDGAWLASASKARDAHTASVLVWTAPAGAPASGSAASGAAVSPHLQVAARLPGHESTVVCLQFSPDSRYLVSSGKDRSLCLFAHDAYGRTFVPVACKRSAHKRIVWDCSWSPDSSHVVTASRDGTVKLWRLNAAADGSIVELDCVHTFTPFGGVAVTALDVLRSTSAEPVAEGWLLALGAESGDLQVRRYRPSEVSGEPFALLLSVPDSHCHGATVRRIRWRPVPVGSSSSGGDGVVEFASCGEDRTVRVHRVGL